MINFTKMQTKNSRILFFLLMTVTPWAFDFKSAGAGAAIAVQGLILFVSLFYFVMLVKAVNFSVVSTHPTYVISLSVIFCLVGSARSLYFGDELYSIFVNILSTLMFPFGFTISFIVFSVVDDKRRAYNLFVLLCLLFTVSRIFIVVGNGSVASLSSVRYQIIGASTIQSLTFSLVAVFARVGALEVFCMLCSTVIIGLSVTRTYLLGFVFQVAALSIFGPKSLLGRRSLLIAAIGGAILIISMLIFYALGVDVVGRWIGRLGVADAMGGYDPTRLTREAEFTYMWSSFISSPMCLLFGKGIASHTSLVGNSVSIIASLVGEGSTWDHGIGYGHNNHMSLLFIGGLIGGAPLLSLQIWNGIQALIMANFVSIKMGIDPTLKKIAMWGALSIVATIAIGFLSGTMNDRGASLWYGISSGMFVWALREIKVARRRV